MDTTQKTREEAAKRPRKTAPEGQAKRPAKASPPESAQQRNGAVRTAEGQRTAEGRPRRSREETPRKRRVEEKAKAPARKRPAPRKEEEDISTKRRAYGRSKPKKKPAITRMAQSVQRTAKKWTAKSDRKKSGSHPQQPTPAVIYTQPTAFNRNRFLIQLLTVTAIVAALIMCLSVFFKVEEITVTGANVYSAWKVQESSGIEVGDGLFTFGNISAGAKVKANLPYVKEVRFGIKLPGTVNIIIKEEAVVYAIKNQEGIWWLMSADGRVIEQTTSQKASNYTKILGVVLDNPIKNQSAVALEAVAATDEAGEVIPVTVTSAQKLSTVLRILNALEDNDIVGDAASVDVTRMEDIVLWYGSRYQVNLGNNDRIDYKIACMNDAILQLSEFQSGILDLSFTIWPDKVIYTPFT